MIVNRDTAPWPMFFPISGNSPPLPAPSWTPKRPHKCPICGGTGFVSAGFYPDTGGTSANPVKCRACIGGVIVA